MFTALPFHLLLTLLPIPTENPVPPPLAVRGVYGGYPSQIFDRNELLSDYGINAVWIGSGSLSETLIDRLRDQGVAVFAEFNTLHAVEYLKDHPDAAPVGPDGKASPPPDGWQGICPTHPGYRRWRMDEFRRILREFVLDGIWLDYHHAQASWEQAEPNLPDTCFCDHCMVQFSDAVGRPITPKSGTDPLHRISQRRAEAIGPLREEWIAWRCQVLTDWVKEFRTIVNEIRPDALLGTFHCPWDDQHLNGALRSKLAIDLKSQAPYLDVFSPMPYHARFGHALDLDWIARQVSWLGDHLGVKGVPGERLKIWPIVQLADWGEPVPVEQVIPALELASRPPATGLTVFHWSGLSKNWEKVERLGDFYRSRGRSSKTN